ncbi:hypothetical protein [Phenylobacterium soli]|uniref:Phage recombination protein Bet n=1 Tax=Phenylobacterium soli TaxID=2170551 RepID=A0A328ABM5_9CAUL|nr:hypothetical protein [Phenylobacterium soli]RAK51626.1 hypothetical protein DJ017_17475 [Phenylobacterium soli]
MNAIVPITPTNNVEAYRASTDAADLCKEIVVASAMEIQKRKYVKVEGWQAIAVAHGCVASARDVENVDGGVRAIGEVRRMSDGALIAQAEGFVGEDEPTWYGGTIRKWKWGEKRGERVWYEEELPKRPDYAIRAMAQTRAISRACRSAFAHVVVMMNAGLSTTPAEEVPLDGFGDDEAVRNVSPAPEPTPPAKVDPSVDWRKLDDEMDACKTQAALHAWNKFREKEIKALPKARFDALGEKFADLLAKLPDQAPAAELSADDVPEFS